MLSFKAEILVKVATGEPTLSDLCSFIVEHGDPIQSENELREALESTNPKIIPIAIHPDPSGGVIITRINYPYFTRTVRYYCIDKKHWQLILRHLDRVKPLIHSTHVET